MKIILKNLFWIIKKKLKLILISNNLSKLFKKLLNSNIKLKKFTVNSLNLLKDEKPLLPIYVKKLFKL